MQANKQTHKHVDAEDPHTEKHSSEATKLGGSNHNDSKNVCNRQCGESSRYNMAMGLHYSQPRILLQRNVGTLTPLAVYSYYVQLTNSVQIYNACLICANML